MTTNKTIIAKKQTPPQQSQSRTGSGISSMCSSLANRKNTMVSKNTTKPFSGVAFDSVNGK